MRKRRERKIMRRSDNCWLVATTVTFNIKDPHQLALLEFAEAIPNYSGTMKRLLAASMEGGGPITLAPTSEREEGHTALVSADDEWDPTDAFL